MQSVAGKRAIFSQKKTARRHRAPTDLFQMENVSTNLEFRAWTIEPTFLGLNVNRPVSLPVFQRTHLKELIWNCSRSDSRSRSFSVPALSLCDLRSFIEKSTRPWIETILHTVLKVRFDRICFHWGEASAHFDVNNNVSNADTNNNKWRLEF